MLRANNNKLLKAESKLHFIYKNSQKLSDLPTEIPVSQQTSLFQNKSIFDSRFSCVFCKLVSRGLISVKLHLQACDSTFRAQLRSGQVWRRLLLRSSV